MKNKITDYSEKEFLDFVISIWDNDLPEEEEDELVAKFVELIEHPAKSDLIFWPKDGQEDSPEGIVNEIKRWYSEQGKPCFKE